MLQTKELHFRENDLHKLVIHIYKKRSHILAVQIFLIYIMAQFMNKYILMNLKAKQFTSTIYITVF